MQQEKNKNHKRVLTVPDSTDQSAIQEVLQCLRNRRKKGRGINGEEKAAVKKQKKKKTKNKKTREAVSVKTSSLPGTRQSCVPERRSAGDCLASSKHPYDVSG